MDPIGPISWPIQIDDSEVRHFDLYYFEFESSRYIVGTVGDVSKQPIPLRIESACIFGHVFRGLKCDCGEQFELALKKMIRRNHGIVAYAVDDDARGHGIRMHFKLYEYRQHRGRRDEREIFEELNKELDARDYTPVLEILDYFNIDNIELITNNPERLEMLSNGGITVNERIPLEPEITRYNEELLLQEKEWLGYETSYQTLEEWKSRFNEELEASGKQYGYIITRDHATAVERAFFDEEPSTVEVNTQQSSFSTMIANFDPPVDTREKVDKIVVVDQQAPESFTD